MVSTLDRQGKVGGQRGGVDRQEFRGDGRFLGGWEKRVQRSIATKTRILGDQGGGKFLDSFDLSLMLPLYFYLDA
jgi:hypothetical protein